MCSFKYYKLGIFELGKYKCLFGCDFGVKVGIIYVIVRERSIYGGKYYRGNCCFLFVVNWIL